MSYGNYGGRGITVCERWRNDFGHFLDDMGARPYNMSIDRIDNNKGYSPSNCRWATREQQDNNRRDNVFFFYKGAKLTIAELSRLSNINYQTMKARLVDLKWKVEDAVDTPVRLKYSKNHAKIY